MSDKEYILCPFCGEWLSKDERWAECPHCDVDVEPWSLGYEKGKKIMRNDVVKLIKKADLGINGRILIKWVEAL